MNKARYSLLLVIGSATGVVIVLVCGLLLAYWFYLATPLMQAGERTKTELLASSYRKAITDALATGDDTRILTVMGELLLLSDPETRRNLISRLEVDRADGGTLSAGESRDAMGMTAFSVEIPIFSEETFEFLGSMRLYREIVLREQQLVFWSMALVLLVLLVLLQVLLWRLLRPLRDLARDVEGVDPVALQPLPEPRGYSAGEIAALRESIDGLLARLRESRKVMERQKLLLESHAKELARSNADLEGFAYVASHDLKAPLRGIDNLAMWLEDDLSDVLEDESKHHMDMLRGRVGRMEKLLDDLLAYSRVGRLDVEVCEVDIEKLIRAVAIDLDVPPRFEIVIQEGMPVFETAPGPLELVFRNLIGNALKHHDRESGSVSVNVTDQGAVYLFEVCDDGGGIPVQYREQVFEMFQTLKARDELEGSGMGLAIVKKVVESQGGMVWLESNSGGRGTAVRFSWGKQWRGREWRPGE